MFRYSFVVASKALDKCRNRNFLRSIRKDIDGSVGRSVVLFLITMCDSSRHDTSKMDVF